MNSGCKRTVALQGTLPNHHLEPEVFQEKDFGGTGQKNKQTKKQNYKADSAVLLFLDNMQEYAVSLS